jgi:hypothetical protein
MKELESKILKNLCVKAENWRKSKHWALTQFNEAQQRDILSAYETGDSPGSRLWAKWKTIKRDVLNVYLPHWVALHVGGIVPSGKSMEDMVLLHREALWKVLVKDTTKACKQESLKPFNAAVYWPAHHDAFQCFGPPAMEKASPVFMAEMSNGPKNKPATKSGGQKRKILDVNGMCCIVCSCYLLVYALIIGLFIQRRLVLMAMATAERTNGRPTCLRVGPKVRRPSTLKSWLSGIDRTWPWKRETFFLGARMMG